MPNTPDTPVIQPDPDPDPPPGDDLVFNPTPDFLGDLDPLDLFGVANAPAPKEWKPPGPVELTQVLPGYAVIRLIGQGGMGAVYEAHETMTDRTVALKFLPADRCASDPAFSDRARREVRLLSKLDHPNIVKVYHSSTTSAGDFYFTMELVPGETLAHRMKRARPGTAESMAILRQVCDGVAHAHSRELIHRDLKPSNIIIAADGRVKVVDFGLAVPETRLPDERLTRTGIAVGTYEYCAPEQLAGEDVDARADIYSLGVITYQLLTGELPVGAFEPPSLRRKAVTQGFDGVVMRALLPDRAGRYQTTDAFRDDLISAHETALIMGDLELIGQDQAKVLQDFYEKTVFDVPPTVRHFIEDKLLTPSGYRDSRPLDDALVSYGIPRPQLERLVERHLLRIEERAGVPRVEISHDRLTGAIQASRDARRAVQADEESRQREQHLRHQMRIRVAIAILGGLALTLGGWGYSQWREAQRAASDEQEARRLLLVMTQMTGGELAERLEPIGRLQVLDPVIKAMDSLFTRYHPAKEDSDWNSLHANYLTQKAGVFAAQGRYTAACDALRTALSLPRGLKTLPAAHARIRLMRHLSARGLGNDAIQEWPALLALLESLPDTAESGHAKALAEDARSRALEAQRNWHESIGTQQSAIALLEKALTALEANSTDRGKWEHDLALMYLRSAAIQKDEGLKEAALAAARRGNEIAVRLGEEAGADPRWRATHARSWSVLAELLPDGPERNHAFSEDLRITEALANLDPENILWLRERARALGEKGLMFRSSQQWNEAAQMFDQAIKAARRVVDGDRSVDQWKWDLASYLLYRGYVDKEGSLPGFGETWLRETIDNMDAFVASTDTPVPDRVYGLSAVLVNLGEVFPKNGRDAEAVPYFTGWIERGRQKAVAGPSWHYLAAVAGWEKGAVQTRAGDIPSALRTFAEATADLERAYRLLPHQDWPSPPLKWRKHPATVLAAAVSAAGPADKAEAKRVGAAALELFLRFSDGKLPDEDTAACATLKNLTQ